MKSFIRRIICTVILVNTINASLLSAAYGGGGGVGGGSGFSTAPQPSAPPKQSNIPLNQPSPSSQRVLPLHGKAGGTGAQAAPQLQPLRPQMGPQPIAVLYTMPGIATLQGNQWVGTADLYNLPNGIGLVVEIVTPNAAPIDIAEQVILNRIVPILKEGGIYGHTTIVGDTPLPYLHFLFMVYPIEKGFVAYCSGRLFESAKLTRVFLKPGITWQVITWEKQELIIFPANELQPQIESVVNLILKDFITQYKVKPEEKPK